MNTFIDKEKGKVFANISKLQKVARDLNQMKGTIVILDNLYSQSEAFDIFKEHFFNNVDTPYFAIASKKQATNELFTPKFLSSSSGDNPLISLHDNKSLIEQVVENPIALEAYVAAIDFATRYFALDPYAITAFDLIKEADFKLESQVTEGSFPLQAKRTELAKLEKEIKLLQIKKPNSPDLPVLIEKKGIIGKEIIDLTEEHCKCLESLLLVKNLKSIHAYLLALKEKGIDIQNLDEKILRILRENESKIQQLPSFKTVIDPSLIAMVVAEKLHLPIDDVGQDEKKKLLTLEAEMNQEIIGQENAVKAVTEVILSARLGMKQRDRPVAVFLCVGPTGVGKTSLAKLLAKKVMGSEEKLIRINMELYSEEHSVANLVGAPLGYRDHDKGAAWLEELKQKPRSVILLDEIEKAHTKVKQIFLSAFDEGFFIDNEGKKVNCSEAIFILTSNAGARQIQSHGNGASRWFGEEPPLETVVNKAISYEFNPEFISRIDKVIIFNKLDNPDAAKKIIVNELNLFTALIEKAQEISLTYTDNLITYLAENGFDPKNGARPLRRIIERTIRPLCTKALLSGTISRGDSASLDITENGTLILTKMVK